MARPQPRPTPDVLSVRSAGFGTCPIEVARQQRAPDPASEQGGARRLGRALLAALLIAAAGPVATTSAAGHPLRGEGSATPPAVMKKIASFDDPTYVTGAPGFPGLLFVTQRAGQVEVVANGHETGPSVPRHLRQGQGDRQRAGPARAGLPSRLQARAGASTSSTPTRTTTFRSTSTAARPLPSPAPPPAARCSRLLSPRATPTTTAASSSSGATTLQRDRGWDGPRGPVQLCPERRQPEGEDHPHRPAARGRGKAVPDPAGQSLRRRPGATRSSATACETRIASPSRR